MQDVDRIAHVEALSQPARHRSARVEAQPLRGVARAEHLHRIAGDLARRRDFGQQLAVRAAEGQLAVGLALQVVAALVHGPVVAQTQQGEI